MPKLKFLNYNFRTFDQPLTLSRINEIIFFFLFVSGKCSRGVTIRKNLSKRRNIKRTTPSLRKSSTLRERHQILQGYHYRRKRKKKELKIKRILLSSVASFRIPNEKDVIITM